MPTEIKAADVKRLREKTGAGMMDCKKALSAAEGDFAQAEKKLKEMGVATAQKRMGRATNEGRIFARVSDGTGGLLEMACETDFVARNEEFIQTGNEVLAELMDSGKTIEDEEIQSKIKETIARIKENMSLRRFEQIEAAENEFIANYIHGDGGHLGVLAKVQADSAELAQHEAVRQFAFDIALHVAAYNPTFLSQETVPAAYREEQESIFKAQAESLGKPENVIDGIVKGKMKKHFAEICLLDQPFVKDDKKSVSQMAEAVGKEAGGSVVVSDFRYFRVGAEADQ